MSEPKILVVDDEASIRSALRMILEYEGYRVEEAENGAAALDAVRRAFYDGVLLDVKMPGMDGMETLEALRAVEPTLPVVMLTGHGTLETAVEATKRGAFDFLAKPPDRDKILITLRNALAQDALRRENTEMRKQIEAGDRIIGTSRAIETVREIIERVAPTDARVLITGENGTGKELVAKAIHRRSPRAGSPMVEVNCAAIPTELIESELFGHEKGSFTGATAQRVGKFEQAHLGTIFLDEVGDMSAQTQAKVLRVLEENAFERVGGSRRIATDVRVLAATNKNLPELIREGLFRQDLYHRLNVIPVAVPPLRERREDIPLLVEHFAAQIRERDKLPVKGFTPDAVEALRGMNWPGNVRELRNAVERLMIIVTGGMVTAADVARHLATSSGGFDRLLSLDASFQEFKDQAERLFIEKQLERFRWNVSRTAEELQIQRSHLYTKMKKYGLTREGEAPPEEE